MPLILAIEPDRRQASKIAALAKNKLHAELVSADSTEHAIEALAGRIPDLILTSLLLSPKDDAALADWLRDSDAAGRNVQTLVIPVLAFSSRSSDGGGLFSRLTGRGKDDAAPDGCDPDMFATQIREYLDHAAEERRTAAEDLAIAAAPPVSEHRPTPPAPPAAPTWTPDRSEAQTPAYTPVYFEVEAVLPEPVDAAPYETSSSAGDEAESEPWSEIALGEEDADGAEDARGRSARQTDDDEATSLELTSEPIDLQRFVDELAGQFEQAGQPRQELVQNARDGREEVKRHRDDVLAEFEQALEVITSDQPAPEDEPNRPGGESQADSELYMPLVGATAWPHIEGGVTKASQVNRTAAADPAQAAEPSRPKKKGKAIQPQTEWRTFDPEQCGFAALLAKLDQMSDDAA